MIVHSKTISQAEQYKMGSHQPRKQEKGPIENVYITLMFEALNCSKAVGNSGMFCC